MSDSISFKAIAARAAEFVLLALAFYFTVEGLDPQGDKAAQYMPSAAYAISCFAISRLLSWRRAKDNPFPIMLEMVAFAVFVRLNFAAATGLG